MFKEKNMRKIVLIAVLCVMVCSVWAVPARKGGIVKSEKARKDALDSVILYAKSVGFDCLGLVQSSIKGGDGNIEFLAHFKK